MLENQELAEKTQRIITIRDGIIIGIASVIAIMTVGTSMTSSVTNSMNSMGANNVTVGVQQNMDTAIGSMIQVSLNNKFHVR